MTTIDRIRKQARAAMRETMHNRTIHPERYSFGDSAQAKRAWNDAKFQAEWDRLESAELVRLNIVPDTCADVDDLLGDTFNPVANPDIPAARLERERAAEIERINRDGVYGVIGEFRPTTNGAWIESDSCYGFVGDDWKGSGYDLDIMRTTIDALKNALRGRCPMCRRTKH